MAERRVPLVVIGTADGKPHKISLTVKSEDGSRRVEAPFAAPR
jgi:hypothetical protein